MTRVLVIDNYDSFTWNLVHLLGPLATSVDVVRNGARIPARRDRALPRPRNAERCWGLP
jgi:anthranilate/para-aminobenzoate synthase component II